MPTVRSSCSLLSILLITWCAPRTARAQVVSDERFAAAVKTPQTQSPYADRQLPSKLGYAFGPELGIVGAAVTPLDLRVGLDDKWALQTAITLGGPLHFDYPYREIDGSILKLVRFYSPGNLSASLRRYQRTGRGGWFGSAGARLQAYRVTAVTTDPTLGGTIISAIFPIFFVTGDGPDDTRIRSRGIRPAAYLGGGYAWRNGRGNANEVSLRLDLNVLQGLGYKVRDGTDGPIRMRDLGRDMSPVRAAVMVEYRLVIGVGKSAG